MARWLRFYTDTLNNHKILRLPDKLYRVWTQILCVASMNSGLLPELDDLAVDLRVPPLVAAEYIAELTARCLLSKGPGGKLMPYKWFKYQYKSDSSTERVKRFRSVSETGEKRPQSTDTDTEREDISPNSNGSDKIVPVKISKRKSRQAVTYTAEFESFWQSYPDKRNNSKQAAFIEWVALEEADRGAAVAAIPAFTDFCRRSPDYRVVHCERFLSQRRFDGWKDAEPKTKYMRP